MSLPRSCPPQALSQWEPLHTVEHHPLLSPCCLRKLTALSGLTASENGDLGHVVVGGALMYRKQRLLVVIHHL